MRISVSRSGAFRVLAPLALALAVCVVILGAYVRLSDAGLGCPDWPGCYGHPIVPENTSLYPDRPLVPGKAWKEMVHRYAAGTLGILIATLFFLARRSSELAWARALTAGLLGLVIFQALLGMWTVTLKLQPVIVMGHLLGGLTINALLLALVLLNRPSRASPPLSLVRWGRLALAVVIMQVVLGGWTSANYAAPVCPDFPTCQGQWWPQMDMAAALQPTLPPEAADYAGGTLDGPARTAIHFVHRLGALLTVVVVGGLALAMMRRGGALRRHGAFLAAALVLQISVGIAMVLTRFPLELAVAHNAGALFVVLSTVSAVFYLHAVQRAPVRANQAVTEAS